MFYHPWQAPPTHTAALGTQPLAAWADRILKGEGCHPATCKAGGAREGTRTPTPLLASGPKPGASTNFATLAVLAALPGGGRPRCSLPDMKAKKAAGSARLCPHACRSCRRQSAVQRGCGL
ncbi:hypothetical protein CBM2585_A80309 [Cupriavidus taiwanensis]|nr:hypothetical protein CBM2585_A80309 [Cupriavidus taiwanensis]